MRLVVPDPGMRRLARLVALDEVMPVHASVTGALSAAAREGHTLVSLHGIVSIRPHLGRYTMTSGSGAVPDPGSPVVIHWREVGQPWL
jgi:hypothetical protein